MRAINNHSMPGVYLSHVLSLRVYVCVCVCVSELIRSGKLEKHALIFLGGLHHCKGEGETLERQRERDRER